MSDNIQHDDIAGKVNRGKKRKIKCPDCGHVWYSRGKGVFYKCPECYKKETGKEFGEHFKKTKGLTLNVTSENAKPPQDKPPKDTKKNNPAAPDSKNKQKQQESKSVKGLFNKAIFKL